MTDMPAERLRLLLDPQTDAEQKTVDWLCGWEADVVERMAVMLQRVVQGRQRPIEIVVHRDPEPEDDPDPYDDDDLRPADPYGDD